VDGALGLFLEDIDRVANVNVLILIVVDGALGHAGYNVMLQQSGVLILIVVDGALGHIYYHRYKEER
tara:strand:+ start:627 stop:827 length:201 start_codon:yes stop_codon:yes gene_type:complete